MLFRWATSSESPSFSQDWSGTVRNDKIIQNTRLLSNLRQTTHECMHLVTCGHFRSCDKDGNHTIRSAVADNPMLHANFVALCFTEPDYQAYCQCKFYIARTGIFYLFGPVSLTLTR